MITFPEYLRQCRAQSGLIQRRLATAIGVDVPMYSRFEHGERHMRREQVEKLAKLLGVDVEEMVSLWLAQTAYDAIAHDRLATRATARLQEMIGGEAATAPQPAPAAVATPAQPAIVTSRTTDATRQAIKRLPAGRLPHYIAGDAVKVLDTIEDASIDCIVTTPPYMGGRDRSKDGIANLSLDDYIEMLMRLSDQARHVLKPGGSLWLNLADYADEDSLNALPHRVVTMMLEQHGWALRNTVVWNKGTASSGDTPAGRLRPNHEYLFHLTPSSGEFYHDDESLRRAYNDSGTARRGGSTRSGVTGTRYFQRIRQLTTLTDAEKAAAERALHEVIARVEAGEVTEYRLYLRESNAVDHQSEKARAIAEHGFYIQTFNNLGSVPPDVWTIAPERSPIERYNVAPDDLYRWPILATCPIGGLVLDPYCGTGTACVVAYNEGRRAIGIDINNDYLQRARRRIEQKPLSLF